MPRPDAFAEERRRRIAQTVAADGRVRLADLVREYGVTEPTIRRDLSVLEERDLLRRTHGGAIAVGTDHVETSVTDRSRRNRAAKDAIAVACAAEIAAGDSVFLDTGTTVQAVAVRLTQPGLNVLTNSVGVARVLADRPDVRHTLLGGQLRTLGDSVTGPIALENLARFTVGVAVLGATGVTGAGISVADLGEAQIKQAVLDRARKVVLAVDSSKFGVTDFVGVCGLDRIDVLVTEEAGEEVRDWCAAHGVEVRQTP